MGRPPGEAPEAELVTLTDAGGEIEALVMEEGKRHVHFLGHVSDEEDGQQQESMPWWCIVVLIAAVLAVSSAGSTFALVRDVPALRLGGWRLQITTALLTPLAIGQYARLPPGAVKTSH